MTGHQTSDDSDPPQDPLARCRQDIDRVDAVLVALLRERTRLALNAGRLKSASGQPIAVPDREAAVLDRVRRLARAPLDAEAAARIFQRIIDETRSAETRLETDHDA